MIRAEFGARRTAVLAILVLALVLATGARAQDDAEEQWRVMRVRRSIDAFALYPHTVFLQIGFHYFPPMTLSRPRGAVPRDGQALGQAQFEQALFDEFDSERLASSSIELGYGYRIHRYMNLQVNAGVVNQGYETNNQVQGFGAVLKYKYLAGNLIVLPQFRYHVSKFDFMIGLGPQVVLASIDFRLRGSTEQEVDGEIDADGYEESFVETIAALGGVAQAGVEYRIRDNWGMQIEYRYAIVPSTFEDNYFDHGGHWCHLGTMFHF